MSATAVIAVARDERARNLLGWLLAGLLALPLLATVAVLGVLGHIEQRPPAQGTGGEIPAGLVDVFNEAARVFDVNAFLLAAIAAQESAFGTGPGWQTINAAGCVGLMQMCVGGRGGDSWEGAPVILTGRHAPTSSLMAKDAYRYGLRPASYAFGRAGHPDVLDSFDAVMAAAVHLRSKVAGRPIPHLDRRAYRAACGYFGACAWAGVNYAPEVLARARRYQAQSQPGQAAPVAQLGGDGLAGGSLNWPTLVHAVSSPFCQRRAWEDCHPGIDIPVPVGTPLHAAADGRVEQAGWTGGYGNHTCLAHSSVLSSCYAHQQRILVGVGQYVRVGQVIGISGCTGRCYGAHLHFEVRIDGQPVCPAAFLRARPTGMCITRQPAA